MYPVQSACSNKLLSAQGNKYGHIDGQNWAVFAIHLPGKAVTKEVGPPGLTLDALEIALPIILDPCHCILHFLPNDVT